jgi:hypothetical protein
MASAGMFAAGLVEEEEKNRSWNHREERNL